MESVPNHLKPFFDPAIYPHPAEQIEMIQTHISWVFLAGEYAYKFKKPVNFSFLDFSSLEKRKYFCKRELELNRRISPAIYLGMHHICRQGESYQLDGDGEVVDYCLKMHRFSQSDLLNERLNNGNFDAAWMDALACDTAGFHHSSAANREIDHIALLQNHIALNLDAASRHIGTGLNRQTIQSLTQFARRELATLQPLLEARQSDGHIRHCHGDLHLKNITLIDGYPRLFDCIEFNDDFSTIDTMSDVAFLIMDCDAHGRPDLGMRFLSRYLEFSGDYSGLKLLPLYLFYRATVRGKVACLLADELEGEKRSLQLSEAADYFELALACTGREQSSLFAIGGLSGSGKSHLALLGCGVERAIMIRSDATRKRIAANHPDLELYGNQMHINTYNAMFAAAKTTIDAGFSVILDATFIHPDSRLHLKQLTDSSAAPLHFFWLDIEETILREQIKKRQIAANDISDADLHVLDLQLEEYRKPAETWVQFLTSNSIWPRSHSR
ncbi:AAA family ATPase [Mariprofundus sp. NF]|uniref:bifunctional aminoglycoside phosphotransferase/ATP-binding protein n=1 Tax=Mariprofundus sp. NF TaxID=2608716 RepID=UPI0015A17956|nr:AAA family ATPase [Mariprofundus sp. NF]NWF39801.1 AAA family ATPase [Mariprofundus sp. NF]